MKIDSLVEQTLSSETIFSGKIITLKKDKILLPDGKEGEREIINHNGGACVLAIRDKKVFFVKQYRYAFGEVVIEIPAGKLEKGEDPENTAKRELLEEAGLVAGELVHLTTIYPTPGYTDEKIYIYYTQNPTAGEPRPEKGEFLEWAWIDLNEAYKMIDEGKITDAKTIIALLYYKSYIDSPKKGLFGR